MRVSVSGTSYFVHACICKCVHAYIVSMCMCVSVRMCVCAYEFVYAIQRVCLFMYVCSFISMCECAGPPTSLRVCVCV